MAALGVLKENSSLQVVIVEKNEVVAHRIGEALLTGTIMTFEEAGITQEIASQGYHRKIGATYIWGKNRDPWYVNYPGDMNGYPSQFIYEGKRCTVHVPRHTFNQNLRDICKRKGVHFVFETVKEVVSTTNSYIQSVELQSGEKIHGSYFIDATGQLKLIISPNGEKDSLVIKQNAKIYAGLFNADEKAQLETSLSRSYYVHVIKGSIHVGGILLSAGDAIKIIEMDGNLTFDKADNAEILVFDLMKH